MLCEKKSKKTVIRLAFLTTSLGLIMPLVTHTLKAEGDRQWRAKVELEAKVGTKRSLGRVGAFAPLMQNADSMLFVDLHMMLDNKKQQEFNGGLGYRYMSSSMNAILGVYGYYDRRSTTYKNSFSQFTVGFEMMTEQWDARINAYLPESKAKKIEGEKPTITFKGHDKLSDTNKEIALRGFDIEAGSKIPGVQGLSAHVGMYHFQGRMGAKSITGPKARINYEFNEYISFEGSVTQDRVRKTNAFAGVTLQFKLGDKGTTKLSPLSARMEETPIRDLDIISTKAVEKQKSAGHFHVVTPEVAKKMQEELEEKAKAEEKAAAEAKAKSEAEEEKGEELEDNGVNQTNSQLQANDNNSDENKDDDNHEPKKQPKLEEKQPTRIVIGQGIEVLDEDSQQKSLEIGHLGTAENPFILGSKEFENLLMTCFMKIFSAGSPEFVQTLPPEGKANLEKLTYVHIHNDKAFTDVDGKLVTKDFKGILFADEKFRNVVEVEGLLLKGPLNKFNPDLQNKLDKLKNKDAQKIKDLKKSIEEYNTSLQGESVSQEKINEFKMNIGIAENSLKEITTKCAEQHFDTLYPAALQFLNADIKVKIAAEKYFDKHSIRIQENERENGKPDFVNDVVKDMTVDTWNSLLTDQSLEAKFKELFPQENKDDSEATNDEGQKPIMKLFGRGGNNS